MAAAFKPPPLPDFEEYDINRLQNIGKRFDKNAYALSDKFFKRRHPSLLQAERIFEDSVLADQTGDTTLNPAIQNELMRAGLEGALSSFGSQPGTLAPGSAGEAAVARNLGVGVMDFQDRNRRNRLGSLLAAENIFPRRSYGLSGSDAVNLAIANTAGRNNRGQTNYSNMLQLGQAQYNQGIAGGNANAAADAAQQQALVQGGTALLSTAALALMLSCLVAQAVYGYDSPQWRIFRRWLLLEAPGWLRSGYHKHGARIASWINRSATLRQALRPLFDLVVNARRNKWQAWT